MRRDLNLPSGERQNALWGRRGENRGNALWGSGKRGILLMAIAAAMIVPVAGSAAPRFASSAGGASPTGQTLLQAAAANPDQTFDVIVQTRASAGKSHAADVIADARKAHPGKARGLEKQFTVINGGSAELTGAQIVDLAGRNDVLAVTLDAPTTASGITSTSTCMNCPYEGINWPYITGVTGFWQKPGAKAAPAPQAPAIAIVDSGVEAGNTLFGGRVIKEVNLTSLTP